MQGIISSSSVKTSWSIARTRLIYLGNQFTKLNAYWQV